MASVVAQQGDPAEIVVVGNGVELSSVPSGARAVSLPENVGIPAGRNAGVRETGGELVLFLDDDGWLPGTDALERLRAQFGRPATGHRVVAHRRPRHRRHPAPARAPAAGRRPAAVGSRSRRSSAGRAWCAAPCSTRSAGCRTVLLRPRGDRPGLARARRGLVDPVRRRHRDAAPGHQPGPARVVLPDERPQPGLAGPPPAARAAGPGLPRRLDRAHRRPHPRPAPAAHLGRRVRRGLAHRPGGAPADELADRPGG